MAYISAKDVAAIRKELKDQESIADTFAMTVILKALLVIMAGNQLTSLIILHTTKNLDI
jgi:hypothetical protein